MLLLNGNRSETALSIFIKSVFVITVCITNRSSNEYYKDEIKYILYCCIWNLEVLVILKERKVSF